MVKGKRKCINLIFTSKLNFGVDKKKYIHIYIYKRKEKKSEPKNGTI